MTEISVVIPAYNEKPNIGITLTKITTFLNDFEPNYEIIVVDDGSTDATSETVDTFRSTNEKVILIKNAHKGKGFAVRTGVLNSTGNFVLLCDGDLAVPIEELKRLLVWVKDNDFDIGIGSREGIGAVRKNEPLIRHIMGRTFNLLVRLLVLSGINDTQCGFKLFRGDLAREIFKKSLLYGDSSKELKVPKVTAFDVEILFIAKKMGKKIKEVPIVWEYRNTRVNNIRDSFYNFLDVLKVRFNDLLGKY
ncbi:hypothetical protein A2716_03765 [candidate division WWE3 bacterium RIFCSPHIGHO2_01_FULL_40_23]|uniref:dolichyl-phosphate beta-glucosyltransferase n=1 Tax=candidate division WWE3 bacterium RIFCSPLOWO2_01_FULL_41_18 TaxID=1802625 RepID=A0A1F4VCN1_UNCKA|nr:MAG: hypothetical protein A2716_03765 [candidate division WWE3 bacterium RIFCSPHIGHO2_01_FULL_40_23]OGC54996.1 MAG: hypothetical protein A3A78_03375 [candidate division WWE3 bacterium RIFCSPLOWO2_01_FULL_41_18]